MFISLNGVPCEIATPATIADVLAAKGYETGRVAVALNRECVLRREFAGTALTDGDEIEVLAPMAGG